MNRAEILSRSAEMFPFLFREITTLSIRGFLPPIHKHWWFRAQASNLFGDSGFPMRYSPCRLHIPPDLHSVYLGYFDMWDHEPLTSRVFTKTLRRGDVVVDVGEGLGEGLVDGGGEGLRGEVEVGGLVAQDVGDLAGAVGEDGAAGLGVGAP